MPALILSLLSVLIWSTLTVLIWRVSHLPPFFSVGIALVVGGLVGLVRVRDWRVPLPTLALGIGGIFGYHALLFVAVRLAPPVEVNLLQYLWPLLIVVLTPVYLPRTHLSVHHVLGALAGLAGAGLVLSGGRFSLEMAALPGYLLAVAAAFVWSSFSLLIKRVPPFSTGAVGGFCLLSGLLSLGFCWIDRRLGFSSIPLVVSPMDWLFLLLLGLGPMGAAFYTWDAAMKRGDPRVIGALAYLTPLLSTLNLVVLGGRHLSNVAIAAMGLIVAGAILGSL
ncbi:MAG TPA: DMT family transporter, partial [Holophaga sp.]|nr:DMT family transporter [Holophaga sp.]